MRRISLDALRAVFVTAIAFGGHAVAQDITTTVDVSSSRSFVPLQSYVMGEWSGDLLFFGGLTDMGLHTFGDGAFPAKKFSASIFMVDRVTGDVETASIDHLSLAIQNALIVTAAATVQYGDTLYLYGGYGPDQINSGEFHTRASVTAIDLSMVRDAISNNQPVPEVAFAVVPCSYAKVTGAGIVKMGDRFALICGADAEGEYAGPDPEYTNVIHIFDRTISMTVPQETLDDGLGFSSPMHRRDVNVLPVTLPDGGDHRPGFAVICGVFESGIFPYENPLLWGEGDSLPIEDELFIQHIGIYEGPIASLYSEVNDRNHLLSYAGLSGYEYTDGEFVWNPSAPWTREVVDLTVEEGAFANETVIGEMPWPVTNAKLVLESGLPVNGLGQVLVDDLPANTPVLIGRIYGGIAAEQEGGVSPTYASDDVLDVYITVTPEGQVTVQPGSFTRVRGLPVSGGLSDLFLDDNSRLVSRPDVFRTTSTPPVQIQVVGASPILNPGDFVFVLEGLTTVNNIHQRIRLFNYDTQKWELVDSRIATTFDSVVEVHPTGDLARFVNDSNGEIKALMQYIGLAFTISPTWNASQDRTIWRIAP